MHLRVLQRGRQTVRADEMFFRNEQPGAGAGFPLCRMLELLRCAIEFDRDRRLRGTLSSGRLRSDETIAKLNDAPPNADGGNEKERRSSNNRHAVIIRLNPVDYLCHDQPLTTNGHEWTRIYKAILSHSNFGCLKLRITPTRRPVIRR